MISRRLIRIKAMQTYYVFIQDNGEKTKDALWKELLHNINSSYNLYIYMHCLLVSVFDYAQEITEIKKNKLLPNQSDLNPNTKFIDNKVIQLFRDCPEVMSYLSNSDYNWSEYREFVKKIYENICRTEYYKNYMNNPEISIDQDIKIINKIISKSLCNNDELDEILEETSIYWNDDLEFLFSNIMQNIKKIDESHTSYTIQDIFKSDSDRDFARTLITKTALNQNKFDKIILDTLQKWELERVALIDKVILHLALCEITEIPNMPARVTMNEYLDISKFYSTDKSSIFINGILDKVYSKHKLSSDFNKSGLGLL